MAQRGWILSAGIMAAVGCGVSAGLVSGGAVSARSVSMVRAGQAASGADTGRAEINAFNKKFIAAHLRMDNAAVLSMWAEDGVSLLPTTEAMIGKPAITRFLTGMTQELKGYQMKTMELDFQGIEVSGDWASEWALEHQLVQPPGRPAFNSYGKLLLVLHREADGNWRVTREMWNQGLKP